jgi:poly(A) polymerase
MQILGVPAGRQVGAAIRFLQNLRVERGELSREDAIAALQFWAE